MTPEENQHNAANGARDVDRPDERPAWLDRLGRVVGSHPRAAIVAALSVGVTLGWLIKRR